MKIVKFKPFIKILAIVALLLVALPQVYSSFTMIDYDDYVVKLSLPSSIWLLSIVFYIAPYALLVGYILKFANHRQAKWIEAGMFALFGLSALCDQGLPVINGIPYGTDAIINILMALFFGAAVLVCFKKIDKVPLPVIAAAIGIAVAAYNLMFTINHCFHIGLDYPILARNILMWLAHSIGALAGHIALLFVFLKDMIPAHIYLSNEKQMKQESKSTPEQALKLLKEQYEIGAITEDEYNVARQEIIANL